MSIGPLLFSLCIFTDSVYTHGPIVICFTFERRNSLVHVLVPARRFTEAFTLTFHNQ